VTYSEQKLNEANYILILNTGCPRSYGHYLVFNSRADSESKSHTHMGPIRNGSGVMSF